MVLSKNAFFKKLRLKQGFSLSDVAFCIDGVTYAFIRSLEYSQKKISMKNACILAKFYHLTFSQIYQYMSSCQNLDINSPAYLLLKAIFSKNLTITGFKKLVPARCIKVLRLRNQNSKIAMPVAKKINSILGLKSNYFSKFTYQVKEKHYKKMHNNIKDSDMVYQKANHYIKNIYYNGKFHSYPYTIWRKLRAIAKLTKTGLAKYLHSDIITINKAETQGQKISYCVTHRLANFYHLPYLLGLYLSKEYNNVQLNSPAYQLIKIVAGKNKSIAYLSKIDSHSGKVLKLRKTNDYLPKYVTESLCKNFALPRNYFGHYISNAEYHKELPKRHKRGYQLPGLTSRRDIGYRFRHIIYNSKHSIDYFANKLSIGHKYIMQLGRTRGNHISKKHMKEYQKIFSKKDYNYIISGYLKDKKKAKKHIAAKIRQEAIYLYKSNRHHPFTIFLKKIIKASKLPTYASIARLLRVRPKTIKNLLFGKRTPRMYFLYRLNKYCHIPLIIALRFGKNYHHLELGSPTYLILQAALKKHIHLRKLDDIIKHNPSRYMRQKTSDRIWPSRAKEIISKLQLPKDYFANVTTKSNQDYKVYLFFKHHRNIAKNKNSFAYRLARTIIKHRLNSTMVARKINCAEDGISRMLLGKTKHTKLLPRLEKLFPKEAKYISEPQRQYNKKQKIVHSKQYISKKTIEFLKKTNNGNDVSKPKFFRTIRKIHQISQRDMARETKIGYSTIQHSEKNMPISSKIVPLFANFYHLPMYLFLRYTKWYKNIEPGSPAYYLIKSKLSKHIKSGQFEKIIGGYDLYRRIMRKNKKSDKISKDTINHICKNLNISQKEFLTI